jgi:hypothetical protein
MTAVFTVHWDLWRLRGDRVSLIRRQRRECPKIGLESSTLRQKSHSLAPAVQESSLNAGITGGFDDNALN